MKKIPIADCPRCGRIILYSSNPADKKLYKTELAAEDYVGRFAQCNKCRSIVAIVDACRLYKIRNTALSGDSLESP